MKNYKRMYWVEKQMRTHYEELFRTGVSELKFRLLEVGALKNAIEEIKSITTDKLTKKLCDMAIERDNIDKILHTRSIFGDNPETLSKESDFDIFIKENPCKKKST